MTIGVTVADARQEPVNGAHRGVDGGSRERARGTRAQPRLYALLSENSNVRAGGDFGEKEPSSVRTEIDERDSIAHD
jgi:hypothetical protein